MRLDDFDKQFEKSEREFNFMSRFVTTFIVIVFFLLLCYFAFFIYALFHPEFVGGLLGDFFHGIYKGIVQS